MIITLIFRSASAWKSLAQKLGIPTIPLPLKLSSEISLIDEMENGSITFDMLKGLGLYDSCIPNIDYYDLNFTNQSDYSEIFHCKSHKEKVEDFKKADDNKGLKKWLENKVNVVGSFASIVAMCFGIPIS